MVWPGPMLKFHLSSLESSELSEPRIMEEFPAPNEGQVTLANWRLPPFNRWSFHHVREIVPTAAIPRSERLVDRIPLKPAAIERLGFEGPDGRESTIAEMLSSTWTDGFLVLQGGQ